MTTKLDFFVKSCVFFNELEGCLKHKSGFLKVFDKSKNC